MKILVIEDDLLVCEVLKLILSNQNYAVETAADGEAAKDLIQTYEYDLILLDVIIPKLDGISLCRQIRDLGLQTPILLLTGRDSSHEKAVGLNAGADDYLVKPFDQEELIARVHALLRRGKVSSQPVLTAGELKLDPTTCQVTYGDEILNLTPKEYALLELLMRNSKRIFSCGMILEHLWSYEEAPGEEAVRTHIKGLRQKLKAAGASSDLVETVYGIGYRLKISQHQKTEKSTSQVETTSFKQKTISTIALLWHKYSSNVVEQVNILVEAADALKANNLNSNLRSSAQNVAHTFASFLGSLGLNKGSQIARKIEKLLQFENDLDTNDTAKIDKLVQDLVQEIGQFSPLTLHLGEKVQNELPSVLVLDNESVVAELRNQAINKGLQVIGANDINTARAKLYSTHLSIVLLDPTVCGSWEDVSSLLTDLKQRKPPVPAVIFTEKTDFASRLQAARKGGNTFLQKPTTPTKVLEVVAQVLKQDENFETNILAVDDDPKILELLQVLLSPWGLKVHTLDNPKNFWEVLEATKPHLLILDVEMPEINGIELCQVVRNDPYWGDLPIVFLTAHTGSDIINQIFTVGADDFVSKPIVGPELIACILNRLERNKLLRRVAQSQSSVDRNSCSYWRTIFDAEPECVKVLAADGTLLEMNPAGFTMIEAEKADDVIGRNIYSLITLEYRDAFERLNQKVFAGGSGTLEFEIITCKGNHRWLQTHAVPMQQPDKSIVAVLITRDITNHKQALLELKKIEKLFQSS